MESKTELRFALDNHQVVGFRLSGIKLHIVWQLELFAVAENDGVGCYECHGNGTRLDVSGI